VAKKLRGGDPGSTIAAVPVLLRTKRNRRRVDVAKKSGELKAAATALGSVALKLLGLIAAFVAIGFGANEGWNWARTTPRFALRDVSVRGQTEATDVELVRLGGILLGQNLIAMDTVAMERAIATHPWIKSVTVRRQFPDQLFVSVTEHRAVAMLSLGELYLVNELATPFKRIKAGDQVDLPLVTGIDREKFAANDAEATASLARALELVDAWNATAVVSEIALSEVNLHPEGVSVVTSAGQQIEFGEGDWAAKLNRLARVQKELRARSMVAEVIRLDNRARPSWVAVQVQNTNQNQTAKKP
jgi:cell division protein FtsQ